MCIYAEIGLHEKLASRCSVKMIQPVLSRLTTGSITVNENYISELRRNQLIFFFPLAVCLL